MTVGERLRALRKEAGLTQKELGSKLGISASMIGQYETNVRNPKYETLKKFASVLNVNISEFVDLGDISPSLNSMLPLLDTVKDIIQKSPDPDGKIRFSSSECEQIKSLSLLIEKFPQEMENSVVFQNMVKNMYFSLYEKLNFPGRCMAVEMVDSLSKDPKYTAK